MKIITTFLFFLLLVYNISFTQDIWYRTNGPTGGPIFSVLETSTSKIFVGTNSGVFKSINSGSLFSPLGLYNNQIIQIVGLNNRLFAVDGNYLLFRSVNEGSSWKDITFTGMSSLFTFNGILFGISPFNGIYKSTNYGDNWTLLNNGLPIGVNYGITSLGKYLYAYNSYNADAIYRSSDNGESWSVLNNDLPVYTGINSFGSFNNTLFVNLITSTGSVICKTTNSGINWLKIVNWNPLNYVNSFVQSGTYLLASVNNKGVYRSSDNGANWIITNTGLSRLNSIILTKGTGKIYASINEYFSNGALFQSSNNGTSWSELNNGLTTGNVISMVLMSSKILAATSNGIYKSANQGAKWSILNSAGLTSSSVNILLRKDNTSTVYAGTSDSGLYVSPDFGTSWKHTSFNSENVYSISISGTYIYAGTRANGVYVSKDNGNTWTLTSLSPLRVTALASKGKFVYAGWRNTHGKPHGGIYISSDKGLNWVACNIADAPVSSIGIFDNDNIIVSSDSVYISKNYGTNWSAVNSGTIIGSPANLVVMGYGDVYVANSNGVAGSYNYGKTWELVSYGLLSTNCQVIAGNENLLLVSPPFFGVWKLPVSKDKYYSPLSNINSNLSSSKFELHQNYPNPFNPVTKIGFSVPKDYNGLVTLKVYDVTGKEISSYIYNTSSQNNGQFDLNWSGENYSSGIYFYKLIAGNYSDLRKMILVK